MRVIALTRQSWYSFQLSDTTEMMSLADNMAILPAFPECWQGNTCGNPGSKSRRARETVFEVVADLPDGEEDSAVTG